MKTDKIIMLCVVLLICFLMIEVSIRILNLTPDIGSSLGKTGQFDKQLHHSLIPYSFGQVTQSEFSYDIKINSDGLRDKEYSITKPNYTYRILMFGDSFTFGHGLNITDTISKLTEKELNKGKQRYEVINFGVSSYSPLLYYLSFKQKGLKYNPDMIIINFDMSDVNDDYVYSTSWNETSFISPSESKNLKIISMIKRYSKTLYFLSILYYEKIKMPMNIGDARTDKYAITRIEQSKDNDKLWELSKSYLSILNELTQQNNITMILTVYPYGHQVSKDEWLIGRKFWKLYGDEFSDTPATILSNFCEEENIEFVNMFPAFKQSKEQLYYDYDGHWNKEGHELASKLISNKIKQIVGENNG